MEIDGIGHVIGHSSIQFSNGGLDPHQEPEAPKYMVCFSFRMLLLKNITDKIGGKLGKETWSLENKSIWSKFDDNEIINDNNIFHQ